RSEVVGGGGNHIRSHEVHGGRQDQFGILYAKRRGKSLVEERQEEVRRWGSCNHLENV
ncbi:hypothetical protein A2U01_0098242, partial [Trifolium medium]|nr:hypothetical protein [Trifolium medium]